MDEIDTWVKKVNGMGADLSLEEDLSIGLMNLVSLEEHFFFSAMKTGDEKYLELLNKTREMRKKFLAKIVTDPKGEEWCISKHLLASSMRLYEVGTKELADAKPEQARESFKSSFELFSLFFFINLKPVTPKDQPVDPPKQTDSNKSVFSMATDFFKKAVDCCKE